MKKESMFKESMFAKGAVGGLGVYMDAVWIMEDGDNRLLSDF